MASIVDTSVKHAYSSMAGAPVINGTAGSLIAALKAFWVTGWGSKTVDSAAISNGVCRLTFASGKSAAEVHSVIALSGASPAALNGEQRVTALAAGWVEFKTDLPDSPVTGSLSFKMPSLGWEEVYSKTNVSVFRPTDPRGTRPFVRIDDSNPLYARVQMYESMSDVDTGVGVSPVQAGGFYWHKRSSASANGVYWMMIGDSRGCYVCPAPYEGTNAAALNGFAVTGQYVGDINSSKSGDAWCSLLTGAPSTSYADVSGCVFQAGAAAGRALMRASHGLGGAVACDRNAFNTGGVSGVLGALGAFPSRANNELRLAPILVMDGAAANGPRGELPGGYFCVQSGVLSVYGSALRFTPGEGDFLGKTLLLLTVGQIDGNSSNGLAWWNVNVPWRA